MPNIFGQIGAGAANTAIGTGMGLLLEHHNDQRQINQEKQLTSIQENAQNRLADATQARQMEMWKNTSYPAQIDQLNKAGLNPGLLYGMSGGGGITTGSGTGPSVGRSSAPTGGHEIIDITNRSMELQMMQAQIELTKAQTNKTNAETPNVPLTGKNIEASTGNINADTALKKTENEIASIQKDIAEATEENAISRVQIEMQKADQERIQMVRNNALGQETYNTQLNQIRTDLVQTLLQNKAIQQSIRESGSRIELNEANIQNMAKEISLGWANWENGARNATTGEGNLNQEQFVNDMSESTKMPIEVLEKILQAIMLKGVLGGNTRTPIEGFRKKY